MEQIVRIRIPNVEDQILISVCSFLTQKRWYRLTPSGLADPEGNYVESGANLILYATAADGSQVRLIRLDMIRQSPYSIASQVRMDLEADAATVIEPLAQILTLGNAPRMAAPLRQHAENYGRILTLPDGGGYFYQGALHGTIRNPRLAQRAGTLTWSVDR